MQVGLRVARGLRIATLTRLRGPAIARRGGTISVRATLPRPGGGTLVRTIRVPVPRGIPRGPRDLFLKGTEADVTPAAPSSDATTIDLSSLFEPAPASERRGPGVGRRARDARCPACTATTASRRASCRPARRSPQELPGGAEGVAQRARRVLPRPGAAGRGPGALLVTSAERAARAVSSERFSICSGGGAGACASACGASAGASAGASTPSASASSPDSYISVTMSQPPTSSPSTNSCGIVGQFESAVSSWRIRGSGRMSTAANGAPSDSQRRDGARREAAHRLLGRALHEEDHVVLGDRAGDRLAEGVLGLLAHGVSVLIDRAWIAAAELAVLEEVVDEPVLLDAAEAVERARRRRAR